MENLNEKLEKVNTSTVEDEGEALAWGGGIENELSIPYRRYYKSGDPRHP